MDRVSILIATLRKRQGRVIDINLEVNLMTMAFEIK